MDWPWIEDLETIAGWAEDLRARIARARLRHELGQLHPDTIIDLGAEAAEFSRVCRALKGKFE